MTSGNVYVLFCYSGNEWIPVYGSVSVLKVVVVCTTTPFVWLRLTCITHTPAPTEDQMIYAYWPPTTYFTGSKLCHYILTVFTTHLHTVTVPAPHSLSVNCTASNICYAWVTLRRLITVYCLPASLRWLLSFNYTVDQWKPPCFVLVWWRRRKGNISMPNFVLSVLETLGPFIADKVEPWNWSESMWRSQGKQ